MSTQFSTLVADESSTTERVGGALSIVSVLTVIAALLVFFQVADVGAPVAGVPLYQLLGATLALLGVGLLAVGAGSYLGALETYPDRTTGVVASAAYGLVGFVAGGLIASQTLGFSTIWPIFALLVGVGVAALSLLPREDLGATLPAGLLALGVGLVFLTGVISPEWTWQPIEGSAVYPGSVAIPVLTLFAGLLAAWTATRASQGFGTRGKQAGAYLLVTSNAAAMLALLVVLVAFIVVRGWAPMTNGIKLGLFTRPMYWFYFPPIDKYVIFSLPGIWFYWPFTMEGVSIMNDINGIYPAIVGTFWLVLGAISISVPLGVGAAVFLTEYAEQGRFTQLVEISTNGLWSTPSIVYGLFGLAFLVPRLGNTNSLLSGILVLSFMMLPLVVITSREALKSVPDEYRDASAALGVGQWETIKSVVLPAAMPGVITGVILGVGRIAGETAPILLVMVGEPFPQRAADVFAPEFSFTSGFPFVHAQLINTDAMLQPISALPYQLFAVITAGVDQNIDFAWGTALVLLLVVLSFYAVGIASRIYFRRKLNQ